MTQQPATTIAFCLEETGIIVPAGPHDHCVVRHDAGVFHFSRFDVAAGHVVLEVHDDRIIGFPDAQSFSRYANHSGGLILVASPIRIAAQAPEILRARQWARWDGHRDGPVYSGK